MKKLLLVLTFLPFFQDTQYPCTLHACRNGIVEVNFKDEIQKLELFNITLEEDGGSALCEIVEDASLLSFSYDPGNDQEVYLFADEQLVQTQLLRQGKASLQIANPSYAYGEEMIEASRNIYMVNGDASSVFRQADAAVAPMYFAIALLLWLVLGFALLKTHKF